MADERIDFQLDVTGLQNMLAEYDRQITELAELYGPNPAGMPFDQGGWIPGGKRVVLNDWLPADQVIMTAGELFVSAGGWKNIKAFWERQEIIREDLPPIIERRLGDVLAWLREAGHDV